MVELFWLLLPVAAGSGWYLGRREGVRKARAQERLPRDYFKGLNYLISEQPDKAIEVFTRMVEVDSETVETHLALGSLFRRRGEVDRAIRVHQNLIARPTLSQELRAQALLELGVDYLRAGLLDRAETLFEQVIEFGVYVDEALLQLLDVYQREKGWEKAIHAARRLESRGNPHRATIAQFQCELGDIELAEGHPAGARQHYKRALSTDHYCARASISLGLLEFSQDNYKAALRLLQRVRNQDIEFLPEVLGPMYECHRRMRTEGAMLRYLADAREAGAGPAAALMNAQVLAATRGREAAAEFLYDELERRPNIRLLQQLVELANPATPAADMRDAVYEPLSELLRQRQPYECRQCGFTAKNLYWQCPTCRNWATVKPRSGLKGETAHAD